MPFFIIHRPTNFNQIKPASERAKKVSVDIGEQSLELFNSRESVKWFFEVGHSLPLFVYFRYFTEKDCWIQRDSNLDRRRRRRAR